MPRPTTRALALLELLQSRNQLGGAELARRLHIDRRTLRRYIALLEEIGIPITAEQGRFGGYRLVPGFKLPPMMFTEDEAQALSLGLLAARTMGLADIAPAIESVQAKLDRVLPETLKQGSVALRESIALSVRRRAVGADTRMLRQLSEAALDRRTVKLRYVAADGGESTRAFDVYGIVFRGGCWYIVGHCHLRAGMRTLRVDRVARTEALSRSFTRPQAFDAPAYLTKTLATLPRTLTIEVLLLTDIETAREHVFEMFGTLEQRSSGVLLRSTADDIDWYARQLLALPFTFDVLRPAVLSTALNALLMRLTRQLKETVQDQVSTSAPPSPIR